jgi:hypothetical protein
LAELINELVSGFVRSHPDPHIIIYSAGRLAKSYGEPIDLTLYRCVQEGSPTPSVMETRKTSPSISWKKADTVAMALSHPHRRSRRPILYPQAPPARSAHGSAYAHDAQRSDNCQPRARSWRRWIRAEGQIVR